MYVTTHTASHLELMGVRLDDRRGASWDWKKRQMSKDSPPIVGRFVGQYSTMLTYSEVAKLLRSTACEGLEPAKESQDNGT